MFINEDICQATLDNSKELWKEVKRLREGSKIAYLQYRSKHWIVFSQNLKN